MSNAQEKREQRLQLLDDHIGQALRASEAAGKPLPVDDGYERTPAELRMGYKILKDAGVVPPEVEVMREIAALEVQLRSCPDPVEQRALLQAVAERRQHLALRLETLRMTGSL